MISIRGNFSIIGKKALDTAKSKLSVFASAFMLPIATLAITSILLALGGLLESQFLSTPASKLGYIIKNFSYPILQALPLLFCVSFAITYTKNDGFAVWCAIIAYLAFIYMQSAFITEVAQSNNKRQFEILFHTLQGNHVHKVFGVYTLNTSFIAAVVIGAGIIPYLFRHHANVKLPQILAFFEGKRFLPLISVLCMWPLVLVFTLFWPWVCSGLNAVGTGISGMNKINGSVVGLDSFIFGFLERSLVPFGLHHAFYSPLWFTSAGGDVIHSLHTLDSTEIITAYSQPSTWATPTNAKDFFQQSIYDGSSPFTSWQGDSLIGLSTVGLPGNKIGNKEIFDYFADTLNINVGRFTGGKYPGMQFGLPAAGLAMIYAAPAERRKEAFKAIIPGIITTLTMGMTEPLEFLFLFSAPKLFFGVHATLMGLSFMLMSVFGAHMTSAFSGGLIELIIFGVIPMAKGTHFWWWAVVGVILAPLYFSSFYWYIKKYDIPTPGRDVVEETVETSTIIAEENSEAEQGSEDSTQEQASETPVQASDVPEQTKQLAIALGGWDNMESLTNCATRLRYTVKDKSKVNDAMLKKAGAIAVKWINDNHVQIIVGPRAESINNDMLKWQGQNLGV